MVSTDSYDVVVMGGGPAGSTSAALLAGKGRRVLLLEKEKFPRYHVGESLMPFCYHTLERLGVIDQMEERAFTKKYSVQFVTGDGEQSRPFYFFQHYDHPSSTTWQVERSEFDHMLLRNAESRGATVKEETRVKNVLRNARGAVTGALAEDRDGNVREYRAPVTIDATGRDALVSSKNRWRRRDPQLDKIAIWTYFRGAKRDEGLDEGSTTVAYLPQKGWFWYIPLRGDIVSVGIVAERDYLYRDTRELAEIFTREIDNSVWIREHLAPGEQFGRYRATGEYSYRARSCAGDGVVLTGDAFAFLDPVFSSGVFLALKTGEWAADAVDEALRAGDVSGSRFDAYGERVCQSIETMRRLVYAFYDHNFSFGELIRKYPDVRPDLTDCLIGNLEKGDFGALTAALREFAEVPGELDYGRRGAASTSASAAALT